MSLTKYAFALALPVRTHNHHSLGFDFVSDNFAEPVVEFAGLGFVFEQSGSSVADEERWESCGCGHQERYRALE